MNDTNGKEILLQYVTVKVPGKTPKGSKSSNAQGIKSLYSIFSILNKLILHSFYIYICFIFTEDSFEFSIISLENKTWHFEANNAEDRDSWISAIEQQILSSLQNSDGEKKNETDAFKMHCIRNKVSGNDACVDCGASSKYTYLFINLLEQFFEFYL